MPRPIPHLVSRHQIEGLAVWVLLRRDFLPVVLVFLGFGFVLRCALMGHAFLTAVELLHRTRYFAIKSCRNVAKFGLRCANFMQIVVQTLRRFQWPWGETRNPPCGRSGQ